MFDHSQQGLGLFSKLFEVMAIEQFPGDYHHLDLLFGLVVD